MYRETSWAGNVWERQLLSWQTLKIKQGSHGGHGEHREKTEENSRGRLSVGLSLWEGPRNAWERLGTPTFKLACSKESSHGDHEGHKEERYLGELTPGLCFLCALYVLCATPSFAPLIESCKKPFDSGFIGRFTCNIILCANKQMLKVRELMSSRLRYGSSLLRIY